MANPSLMFKAVSKLKDKEITTEMKLNDSEVTETYNIIQGRANFQKRGSHFSVNRLSSQTINQATD